ncbi:MAG: type II toxin-antitoxin system HicA family toxin [Armatimonadetes bacterium]|nr:type II toxin-antitoxin system HicA family toxin [Armatimonadota bacterium]
MSILSQITGHELIRALQRMGFYIQRKRGSHRFLRHREDYDRYAVVAVHKGETIPPGTLRTILRTAKITVEELKRYL